MNEPFIQVSGLQKTFSLGSTTVQALNQVDLEIPQASFCLVMGPSGSGKSTLLYLIGGLDRPSAGRILVDGQRIDRLDENELAVYRRRTVGFVFQSFNLIPSMSALDNVVFPMRFAHVSSRKRKEAALEMLARMGLEDRALHKPTELSGGQQQRVAIARALVNRPRLIVADEPTGNLDTASGEAIMQVLADLHRDGATVMVVTHDPRMMKYADRAVHILDGRITQEN
ncbi:MAG: ABC transporter ATP-binding protein [Anaerolineales bacterium]|nr:ABC transporter ATP-binding protein [Anaerolineales bacterium]